jgi:hypothetical protein
MEVREAIDKITIVIIIIIIIIIFGVRNCG